MLINAKITVTQKVYVILEFVFVKRIIGGVVAIIYYVQKAYVLLIMIFMLNKNVYIVLGMGNVSVTDNVYGYTGDDCSIKTCLNNCSGEEYGKCIIKKPISQCECKQELKRGGDDCSLIFCLNNCGEEGKCNRNIGECICPKNYYGIDCSVYVIGFRQKSTFISFDNKFLILFLIILI